MSTNAAADLDVFIADCLRIFSYGIDESLIAVGGCQLQNTFDGPSQIYRRWPRLEKRLCGRTHAGYSWSRKRGQVQAPCCGCANERGAADVHLGYGCVGVLPRTHVMHRIRMRQQPLVDDLYDRRIIGFEPNSSKSFCCHVAVSLISIWRLAPHTNPSQMRRVKHGASCWQENY
jgi:hypothetical protein